MIIRPDYIVYIWLLPLTLFIIIPLCMLAAYLLVRFIGFMLLPRRFREQEVQTTIPEQDMEKVL